MKKLNALLFLLLFALVSHAQTIKFLPATPELGKTFSFIYDPKGGNLNKLANVNCVVKAISSRDYRITFPIKLTKVGEVYKGEFTPRDSVNLAVFVFSADGTVDENPNGYYTKLYKNGQPTAMSIFLEGHLFAGFGHGLAKIKTDREKALAIYKQSFDLDAAIKEKYWNNYLLTLYTINKAKGEKEISQAISFFNKLKPSENNMLKVAQLYTILKNKVAADSVYDLIKVKYPKGTYALNVAVKELSSEKDHDKREEKFNELLKNFSLDINNKNDLKKVSNALVGLGIAFLKPKNFDKVEFYIDKIESKATKAVLYYSFAWKNEKIKEDLPFLAKFSKKSMDLIEAAKQDQMPDYYNSREDYLKNLEETYANYEGVYAVILDLQGENAKALAAIEDAVNRNKFNTIEMNANYVSFLAKNDQKDKAIGFAERFVKAGQTNDQLKNDLKALYSGSLPFETYFANLEHDAIAEQQAKLEKEMINKPAPKFTLMNLKGKQVELASLKGKVVIVDYWATWCGPCIASFPGMQKAIDKYKNDPNVVFLFINTWQREDNREKVVRDWLAANPKYAFNVLLDTKSKTDPDNFEVVDQYKVEGIPTKFVIDGNGNIRFKKVGFDGTADGTVKELDMMIALAKANGKPEGK